MPPPRCQVAVESRPSLASGGTGRGGGVGRSPRYCVGGIGGLVLRGFGGPSSLLAMSPTDAKGFHSGGDQTQSSLFHKIKIILKVSSSVFTVFSRFIIHILGGPELSVGKREAVCGSSLGHT